MIIERRKRVGLGLCVCVVGGCLGGGFRAPEKPTTTIPEVVVKVASDVLHEAVWVSSSVVGLDWMFYAGGGR